MSAAPRAEFEWDPDPRRLGRRLVEGVRNELARSAAAVRAGLAPSPIAVVTPTRRLRDHVTRLLTRELGATAGVEFLLHQDLGERALAAAGRTPPIVLPAQWLAALLQPRLAQVAGPLAATVRRSHATLLPLLSTCRDLRDAGFTGEELVRNSQRLSPTARTTLELHGEYEALVADLESCGFGDAASRTRAALGVAPRRLGALFHHGAYELTGATRELVRRSLPERATFLVPTTGRDRQSRALAAAFGAAATGMAAAGDREFATPARAVIQSAATPRDELRFALRQLLAWHARDGIPLDEMALLCRSGASHAAAAVAEAELHDGAFAGPERPWAEHAAGGVLLMVIGHLADPHDRVLARAARRRWPAGWPSAAELARRIEAAASLAARIDLLREPLETTPLGPVLSGAAAIARALADSPLAAALPVDGAGALRLVRALIEETGAATRTGSIELEELHQVRGLSFRRAVLIGANEKLLPRTAGEDFFLPDADRARLSDATGRPLEQAGASRDDEELLLASARATVAEELVVSYARSDGEREQMPSTWLDRLAPPHPTLVRSRHPFHQLVELHSLSGLLAPSEALLLALPGGGAAIAGRTTLERRFAPLAADDWSTLERAWRRAAATEAWDGTDFAFDGVLGKAPAIVDTTSPSRLERIGRCPLQHFFADVLQVAEPEEESTSGELDVRARGELFHAVLERLYPTRLPPPELPERGTPAFDALMAELEAELRRLLAGEIAKPRFAGRIAPSLLPVRLDCFARELARFVLRDWRRIAAHRIVGGEFESTGEFELPGAAQPLRLFMRFDRILRDADGGEHLGDYKSARSVDGKASLTAALRGTELQLALYGLSRLAAERPLRRLELLSLDPSHDGDEDDDAEGGGGDEDAGVSELDVSRLLSIRADLEQTLRVLETVRRGGAYPLAADESDHGVCGRCAYAAACRHAHGATRARVAAAAFAQPWRGLAAKSAPRASGRKPAP
jgi:hypothetical protein